MSNDEDSENQLSNRRVCACSMHGRTVRHSALRETGMHVHTGSVDRTTARRPLAYIRIDALKGNDKLVILWVPLRSKNDPSQGTSVAQL